MVSYKGVFCFVFGGLSQLLFSQNLVNTIYKIPETGITKGFTNFYGEDNDITINQIILRNINEHILIDSNTLLMWQRTDGGEMNYADAKKYCDTLSLGGYDDWRLPTPIEAYSILNFEKNNPALDPMFFKSTGAEYWYTSYTQNTDTNKVWVTNSGGGIGNHLRSETISMGGTKKFHVRAVRNTWTETISKRFVQRGSMLVKDSLSKFTWLILPDSVKTTWEQALNFAMSISSSKCRLPNIKELQTLVDYSKSLPCLDTKLFPSTSSSKYWSSSTLFNQSTKAWYLDAKFGITTYFEKTSLLNLAMVCDETNQNKTAFFEDVALEIYPNPADEKLHIRGINLSKDQVKIFNPMGQELSADLFEISATVNSETVINLENLKQGSYVFSVWNKSHWSRFIFIKI